MTEFAYIATGFRHALAGLLFLAVLGQLALCLYRYNGTGDRKYCAKDAALFLVLLIPLSFVTAASGDKVSLFLPWVCIPLLCVILFVYTCIGIYREKKMSEQRLSPKSVKQTLDKLNTGVLFADSTDKVTLVNDMMRNLVYSISGHYPQTLSELKCDLKKTEKICDTPALYRFPNGKIWRFQTVFLSDTELSGFTQTSAWDVTELYEVNANIRRKNEELQQTNEKLKKMYDRLSDRIREQEILSLKMRIHDDIGASLIAISDILRGDMKEDAEKQLAILQNAVGYFSSKHLSSLETFEAVRRKAAKMNVALTLKGYLPSDETIQKLVVSAACECVTNCIYHAKGTEVIVTATSHNDIFKITITNNGEAPKDKIAEGGGLSELRKSVEAAGGEMYISYSPAFALILNLPGKGQEI